MTNFDPNLVLSIALAVCAAVATYVSLRVKSEVLAVKADNEKSNAALEARIMAKLEERERALSDKIDERDGRIVTKLEEIRRDFATGFMPAQVASEQRSSMMHRVEKLESEVAANRTRIHEISGEIMKNLTAELFRLNGELTDKARRTSANTTNIEALQALTNDFARRLHDLER